MNTPSAPALASAQLNPEDVGTVRNLAEALPPDADLERIDEFNRSDSWAAERLRWAMHQLPVVGDWFAGFELIAVLGRGAFGRVYLARQGDLADRYVALKISTDLAGESRTLARLQHTNIVPIYSIHRVAPFQAVCMPYFGATTLGHLLAHYRDLHSLPESGRQLVDTLCVLNEQTDAPSAVVSASRNPGHSMRAGERRHARARANRRNRDVAGAERHPGIPGHPAAVELHRGGLLDWGAAGGRTGLRP